MSNVIYFQVRLKKFCATFGFDGIRVWNIMGKGEVHEYPFNKNESSMKQDQKYWFPAKRDGWGWVVLTVIFLVICWRTGEPPCWRWGKRDV